MPEPRAQHLSRPPERCAHVLPMIDRTAMHFPGVPTAADQQGRLLRIRPAAGVAAMPLDPHLAAAGQKPGMARIVPPLAGRRAATLRAAPPIPARALR